MGKGSRAKQRRRDASPAAVELPPDSGAGTDRITAQDTEYRSRSAALQARAGPMCDSASLKYAGMYEAQPGFRLRAPVVRLNLPESERMQ